jgi:hypothetical protein
VQSLDGDVAGTRCYWKSAAAITLLEKQTQAFTGISEHKWLKAPVNTWVSFLAGLTLPLKIRDLTSC